MSSVELLRNRYVRGAPGFESDVGVNVPLVIRHNLKQ